MGRNVLKTRKKMVQRNTPLLGCNHAKKKLKNTLSYTGGALNL